MIHRQESERKQSCCFPVVSADGPVSQESGSKVYWIYNQKKTTGILEQAEAKSLVFLFPLRLITISCFKGICDDLIFMTEY